MTPSAAYTIAAFAQLASGRLIDRRPLRGVLMTLACGELLACLVLAAAPREAGALALLPLAVCVFAGIPIYDAAAAGAVASRWRARLFALKYLLSLAVGAAAVPLVATLHTPEQGFAPLFARLAACSTGLLVSALLLPAGFGPAARSEPACGA